MSENWWLYGKGYWQRDDGAVAIARREGVYFAQKTHVRGARYADEEIGSYSTLEEAIQAADIAVPLDAEQAAAHRADRATYPEKP